MVKFTILAGGYTSFIASYMFDSETNNLTYLNKYTTGDNPSWITSHPTNKSVLYAVNENVPAGALQSFTVGPEGALTLVDTISSGGSSPPYCGGLSTGQVAIVNYGSGTASVIPTTTDLLHFSTDDNTVVTFPVPTTGTQGMSEPHMTYQYYEELLIPDKGNDKIWRLSQNGSPGEFSVHGQIAQPIGSGPRHIQIYENQLYTIHELASTLTLQDFPTYPNFSTPLISNVSTIPPHPPAGSIFAAAEVLIPLPTAEFPKPYIYTSNRNIGVQDPRGDTIAIFEKVNNQLVLRNQVYTGLNQIRGMMHGQQAGEGGDAYIVAAGFAGTAGVKVYKRTEGGANLEEVAVNTELPTRTSFVWLKQ
ncbi:Lactonase, 7-bladed beta-propeller-domain-containing protein [Suillus bovinus]|uniref:Lactonase, 7-bladed beta-propeller-domain-containing protein n=1 Tax=Suillus bovinus TaxID=48563 RepID=UPI001B86BFB2|nr:Lactonase, 7-bladed beta-propeller-domain-containing protein [Suillus bovinus]KAG2151600.1 Lactonase, 7-bladed beta-propeller-domain-containing protein [Suillus bovinus]